MQLEDVLPKLKKMIVDIVGEQFISEEEIKPGDNIHSDLEMDSIEIVQLADAIKVCYGTQVDVANWLSNMEIEDIIALDVKSLGGYILQCQ